MKLCLTLIASLLVAAGCKTDSAGSTAGSAAPEAEQSAHTKGRSGKIDLPPRRPMDGDQEKPGLPDDPDRANPEDRRARREERRKARTAELDTDGDGKISDQERDVARKARMDEMKTRLDTNGDGKLTVDELQGSRMSRRFGDVTAIDTDKNGEISADELQKSMESMRAQGWGRRRGGDPNGSGAEGSGEPQ